MSQVFINKIHIDEVRHLHDLDIEVSPKTEGSKLTHIIFTGKNGSGKTSLLDAIAGYLESVSHGNFPSEATRYVEMDKANLQRQQSSGASKKELYETEKRLGSHRSRYESSRHGIDLSFNVDEADVYACFERGELVLAYFGAQRAFSADVPRTIEKVAFKDHYDIHETPRSLFIKYLLDLKMTQALAATGGRQARADEIQRWFDRLQRILRDIYEDETLTIEFDEDTYRFSINERGRDPFDFNEASDGFSAVLDIVVGLMLRMAGENGRSTAFDLPGIALIDEVENHLHLSLQKRIIPYLSELFPNVQFVVTTHSPFVLSSVNNAVVYDLENKVLLADGLSDSTYESIVEGYFNMDGLSVELRKKYDRYLELADKKTLTPEELIEVSELEMYLDEIPDYLALGVATEYKRRKLELHARGLSS